jgi:hypothetical protein
VHVLAAHRRGQQEGEEICVNVVALLSSALLTAVAAVVVRLRIAVLQDEMLVECALEGLKQGLEKELWVQVICCKHYLHIAAMSCSVG